jgi:hypothetical protein
VEAMTDQPKTDVELISCESDRLIYNRWCEIGTRAPSTPIPDAVLDQFNKLMPEVEERRDRWLEQYDASLPECDMGAHREFCYFQEISEAIEALRKARGK